MPKKTSATKVEVWNVNVTHGMFGQRKSQMQFTKELIGTGTQ